MMRILTVLAALLLILPASAFADPAGPGWWRAFHDPALDALIDRMHADNPDIAQYAARLAGARAAARLDASAAAPQAAIAASASRAGGPLINAVGASGALYTTSASVAWEVDVLGKNSARKAAYLHDVAAATSDLAAIRLLAESETAMAYFGSLAAQSQLTLAEQDLADAEQMVGIGENRQRLGFVADSGIERQRHLRDEAREALAAARLQQTIARNRLAALVGDSSLVPPEGDLPDAPQIPGGLADTLLARRPDVLAARARVEAADARVTWVRRAWLPSITLTASGGSASPALGDLLASASRGYGLGLLLGLPIFDGGRHRAEVAGARAAASEAEAAYRQTILAAFRETADTLATASETRERLAVLSAQTDRAEANKQRIAASALAGLRSQGAVIAADHDLVMALQKTRQARFDALATTIRLIKCLGGNITDH